MRESNTSAYWRLLKNTGPSILSDMGAVIARVDELDIWDDICIQGTVLSRSGLELRWESHDLPFKLRDFITEGSWNVRRGRRPF